MPILYSRCPGGTACTAVLDGAFYAVTDEQERWLLTLDAAAVRHFAETAEEAPPHLYPLTAGVGTGWGPLQRCLGEEFPLSLAVLGGRPLCDGDGDVVVRHVTAAQAQAVARFRSRAGELAKSFGFNGYTLREVSVHAQEPGVPPRPRMLAMEAKSAADAPVPVEAGKAAVVVNVSGSVQLR